MELQILFQRILDRYQKIWQYLFRQLVLAYLVKAHLNFPDLWVHLFELHLVWKIQLLLQMEVTVHSAYNSCCKSITQAKWITNSNYWISNLKFRRVSNYKWFGRKRLLLWLGDILNLYNCNIAIDISPYHFCRIPISIYKCYIYYFRITYYMIISNYMSLLIIDKSRT